MVPGFRRDDAHKEAGRYFVVIATSAATTRSSKAVPLLDCFAVGLQ
jgi:hypothetical protein